jgi:predicted metal-dependent HD superfamily phosphohydrolase
MKESHIRILASVKAAVKELFAEKLETRFVFHNLIHTIQVAEAAEAIATFYQFDEEEKVILIIAAWFHDTGFTTGRIEEHETESINLAQSFLLRHSVRQPIIEKVSACILATKMPQSPVSGIDKIICDADLFHLGTNNFRERTELLRQELQRYYHTEIAEKDWDLNNIQLLKSHHYFTGYCQQMLEPVKQQWLMKLEKTKFIKPGKRIHIVE